MERIEKGLERGSFCTYKHQSLEFERVERMDKLVELRLILLRENIAFRQLTWYRDQQHIIVGLKEIEDIKKLEEIVRDSRFYRLTRAGITTFIVSL